MSTQFRVTLAVLVPVAGVVLILCAGMTNAYGSGTQLRTNVGDWFPDGDRADTFWDASIIDLPGFSLYAVHCHARMRLDVQLGATGPLHSNPCYAAMGMYRGGSEETENYMTLPRGDSAIYRSSVNWGPWTYSIGNVIYYTSPPPLPG